jgi:Leucine-rich repeat (LRR) protein
MFKKFPALNQLILTNNKINQIEFNSFYQLSQLKILKIDYNNLTSLNNMIFNGGITSLISNRISNKNFLTDSLFLNNNFLSKIESYTFEELNMVRYIDLSFNRLQLVDLHTFTGLMNLRTFKLNNNLISSITDNSFSTLSQLIEIDLSHNRLSTINRGTFNGLNSIEKISLKSNQIISFDVDSLSSLSNLKTIDVDRNPDIPTTYTNIPCSSSNLKVIFITNKYKI